MTLYLIMPVYWLGALVLVCGGWLMASDARRKSVNRELAMESRLGLKCVAAPVEKQT